jgi:hypothetical protein
MIRFACPACAKTLKVPDHSAGKKGPCPHCGQRLQVPATARNKTVLGQTPPQEADWHNARLVCQELPPSDEHPSYEEPMRTPNGTKLGCVALSIALVALVCMGVAIYFLSQDTSGQAIQKETPHLARAMAGGTIAPQHGNPLLGCFCLLVFAVVIVGGIGLLIWYQAQQQQAAANRQKEKDKEYYRLTTGWFKSLEVGVIEHNRELSDILQDLYVLHSQLRITIPIGFAERIGELRAQVDRMNRRKIAPNFCQLCYTVLNQYAGVSRLANTEVRNFGITGGGFGIAGAMKGILLAEGFNMISRQFGNAKTNAIVRDMQACLARAEEVLSTFKKTFP